MKLKASEPIFDLKDPIKPTEFASLEKIKNQKNAVEISHAQQNGHMPRLDQQVATQKQQERASEQFNPLSLHDWQWLKNAYQQAVLVDELKRRAGRENKLEHVRLADDRHAQALTSLRIEEQKLKIISAAKETERVLAEKSEMQDRLWRDWIDKLDFLSLKNKKELWALFLKKCGFKLGFLPQPWNQKHMTEVKDSLSSIILDKRQKTHIEHALFQTKLNHLNIDRDRLLADVFFARQSELNIAQTIRLNELRQARQLNAKDISHKTIEQLSEHRPGYLHLPEKIAEIMATRYEQSLYRFEKEAQRMENIRDLRLFSKKSTKKFLEMPSPLQAEIKQENQIASKQAGPPDLQGSDKLPEMKHGYEQPHLASLDVHKKSTSQGTTNLGLAPEGIEAKMGPDKEQPAANSKPFKPAFSTIISKQPEEHEPSKVLDLLRIEGEQKKRLGLELFEQKLAQLQAASYFVQQETSATAARLQAQKEIMPTAEHPFKVKKV
jgi:hypothetical protein